MSKAFAQQISDNTGISNRQVSEVISLLDEGATIPFIARYRKERTGNLDEVAIIAIRDEYNKACALQKRRESILASMKETGNLTKELEQSVLSAPTIEILEDIYLPFKPRAETRADKARKAGLAPLAEIIFSDRRFAQISSHSEKLLHEAANSYLSTEQGINNIESAIGGACDIISEYVNEHVNIREKLREIFNREARLVSKVTRGKKEAAQKYKDYFDWNEMLLKAPSHRVLAIFRGNSEKLLSCKITVEKERALGTISQTLEREHKNTTGWAEAAIEDAWSRLLSKSLEREFRKRAKEKADNEAIRLFSQNLRKLLLAPPLGAKPILAIDPGLRTGCKTVYLNEQGELIENTTIYPLAPHRKIKEASAILEDICRRYPVEAIAIGNGTGGREAFSFVKKLKLNGAPVPVLVNESGASVYSASDIARAEFPHHDITVRGAVSIGRRLIDPLAELVKIDPKAIGVGQYQHDVDQKALKNALDDVVKSAVNAVGVDINTASPQLLAQVSGLTKTIARNIIAYRNRTGPFKSRAELFKVKGIGEKAFEQCAGFLKINNGNNPLDATAVHPESYNIVEQMAHDLSVSVPELISDKALQKTIKIENYISEDRGTLTLKDIMDELNKPGRDPRDNFEPPAFQDNVNDINDLSPGMKLPGIVTNVTGFGAFVDLGVHQDGLVHISQMADRFVSDPFEIVSPGDKVTVTVLTVDVERKRIGLSLK